MNRSDLNRRDFHKLTMAAFGGMLSGSAIGCAQQEPEEPTGGAPPAGHTQQPPEKKEAPEKDAKSEKKKVAGTDLLLQEPHVCRGLNTCEGKGKTGENACAGQGACATVEAHSCAGQNDCKGQGGCGAKPGQNACKGMGKCQVPLNEEVWKKARQAFETAMQKAGNPVGEPPPKGDAKKKKSQSS